MIKIDEKSENTYVFIPKTLTDMIDYKLSLFNGKNEEYNVEIKEELGYFKNFYYLSIDLSNIPNGEYHYKLYDETIHEDGLIKIGIVVKKPIENKIENTIKQYGE